MICVFIVSASFMLLFYQTLIFMDCALQNNVLEKCYPKCELSSSTKLSFFLITSVALRLCLLFLIYEMRF